MIHFYLNNWAFDQKKKAPSKIKKNNKNKVLAKEMHFFIT